MEEIILVLLGISVFGFVAGLAGKARAVKKSSPRKSEIYTRITTISLILMFIFVILYQFVD